jgi:putative selenium metabolism protein SsnA
MSTTTILGNGTLITGGPIPRTLDGGAVAWRGDTIAAVGHETELRQRLPDAGYLDARGGLIVPGFINLHHHCYTVFGRGLDPGIEMDDFATRLEGLWWRLDRALTTEAVTLSALLTAAESIRRGCTTVFDHHSSPSCTRGSLDAVAGSMARAGLSAVLCYEISDRNGRQETQTALDENIDFCQRQRRDPRIRGTLGLHASFTLSDETLREVARRRPERSGCHIHVAEDQLDVRVSNAAYGAGPVQRLERFGLLGDRSLLAHGVHLGRDDLAQIAVTRSTLIHNPESNANTGVGRLNPVEATRIGCLVGLGTDGVSSSMLGALRAAFLGHRGALRDPRVGFEVHPQLLVNNALVARRFFDQPLLGELVPDAPADIAVIDSPAPTPIDGDNLFSHLVYGAADAPVRHTIARGRVLLEDFQVTTLDVGQATAAARELAPEVWQRFHAIAPPGDGDDSMLRL